MPKYIEFDSKFDHVYGYVYEGILYINLNYKGSDKIIVCP
jgi:hypothetical protein